MFLQTMFLQIMFRQIIFPRSLRFLTSSPLGRCDALSAELLRSHSIPPRHGQNILAVSYAGVCVAGRADSRGALQFFDDRSDIIHPRRRWRKIAYGRRSLDQSLDLSVHVSLGNGSFWTIRGPARQAGLLFVFRNNSMNTLDLAFVQV